MRYTPVQRNGDRRLTHLVKPLKLGGHGWTGVFGGFMEKNNSLRTAKNPRPGLSPSLARGYTPKLAVQRQSTHVQATQHLVTLDLQDGHPPRCLAGAQHHDQGEPPMIATHRNQPHPSAIEDAL
jgi:hypothetical protein